MLLAEVIGSAVRTITVESIKNKKFKLVKLIKPDNEWAGSYSIVEDMLGTGYGDTVIITTGSGSRFTETTGPTHTDAAIIARIDDPENLKE